jgi:hypothetical protein
MHINRPLAEPTLTLPADHVNEVQELIDTDDHVTDVVNWCIAQIELAQRTLPERARYADLIESLRVALHDDMPAPRHVGDDPFC